MVAWVQSSAPAGSGLVRGPLTIRSRARGKAGRWGSERKLGSTGHFVEAGIDLAANAAGESIAVWRGLRPEGRRHVGAVQSAFRRPSTAFGGAQTVVEPRGQERAADRSSRSTTAAPPMSAWNSGAAPRSCRSSLHANTRRRAVVGHAAGARRGTLEQPAHRRRPRPQHDVIWRGASIDTEGNGAQSGALLTRTRTASGSLTAVRPAHRDACPQLLAGRRRRRAGQRGLAARRRRGGRRWHRGRAHQARRPARAFGPEQTIATGGADEYHGGLAALSDGTLLFAWSFKDRTRVVARLPGGSFGATEFDEPGSYPLIGAAGTGAVMAWNSLERRTPWG